MTKTGKKFLALLLAALMLFSIAPLNGLGELLATKVSAAQQGDYTYEVIDSEVTILDVKSSITGDVVIPDTLPLNGVNYPVTRIGYRAFDLCKQITSVTIPEGVTALDGGVFYMCSALKTVTLPNSLKTIGNHTFGFCSVLEGLTIPENVTKIGNWTFMACYALTSIVIPDSVTQIGENAFSACTGLTSVLIGKGVQNLGESVFSTCHSLTEILVDGENPYFLSEDGVLFNKDKTLLVRYPAGKAGLSYTVPQGVTRVGCGAFADNQKLEEVTISDSVTDIDSVAFPSCYSLETLNLGEGVKNIGAGAFSNCNLLTSIEIPDSVITIGERAFYNCFAATNLTLGEGVTNIGDEAFSACSLTSVTLPKSVTNLGEAVFSKCELLTEILVDPENPNYSNDENGVLFSKDKTKLLAYPAGKGETSYTVPQGVTEIGNHSFYYNPILTDITVSDSVTVIGEGAFSYSIIKNVTIGTGVTLIDYEAFYECDALTGITVPDNVKTIEDCAFGSCNNLANVDLGSGVTSIGYAAFTDCYSLTNITVPDSVTHLGKYVFNCCDALESAVIGNGVTEIGYCAFYECGALTGIVIPDSVTVIDDFAFQDCDALATVTIGNGVTHIDDCAFQDCDALTTVTFGNSLTYIGRDAFSWCTQLGEINIPEGVTYIGDRAFYYCEALATITLPDSLDYIGTAVFEFTAYYDNTPGNWENGVLYIGNHLIKASSGEMVTTDYVIRAGTITVARNALSYCGLTSVTIPGSVENLGDFALAGNDFTEINISSNLLTVGNGVLADCELLETITVDENNPNYMVEEGVLFDKDQTLLVAFPPADPRTTYDIPDTVKTIGSGAFSWCDALTQITIPQGVTKINSSAFLSCTNLSNVTIPETVEEIGNGAFCGCSSFTEMEIPKGIEYIDGFTFGNCTALQKVSIPNTVFTIGNGAFDYCESLTDVYYEGNARNWDNISLSQNIDLLYAHIHCEGVEAGHGFYYDLFVFFVDAQGNATVLSLEEYPGTDMEIPATCSDSDGEYPVTGIYEGAFSGVYVIRRLTIPKSITLIGKDAFKDCDGIRDVYYEGTEAQWNDIDVKEGNEDLLGANIHFLGEEIEEFTDGDYTYTLDENGNATITKVDEAINGEVEIPETFGVHPVTQIGAGAFSNCNLITEITIHTGIVSIGENAFAGCDALTDVYYEGTAEEWGNNVFVDNGNANLLNANFHSADDGEEEDYTNAKLPETTVKTARYKNNVTMKITATGIPANGFLVVDGRKIAPDATGTATFETEFQAKEGKTFKAHIEDADGNIKVAEKEYKVIVDTGFFAKLVAFFVDFIFNGFKWKKANVEF